MQPNFLQIHTLTGYAATLLNRDDIGRAKRLPFGGADRIRVSSQCLKRHWRTQAGEWSLAELGEGRSLRSRRIFSDIIAPRLAERDLSTEQILNVLVPIRAAVLGESVKARATKAKKDAGEPSLDELHTEQVIVLGAPEVTYLTDLAAQLAQDSADETKKAVEAYFKSKDTRDNLKALTQGAGLDASLFGRMVTSDLMARTDAAIHVAHAFTVHAEEAEPDYFSALDDLLAAEGELGSGHINTTELTSGLFYGYVVVDLRQLLKNLSGDRELAAEVVRRLVHLIATVSPGAKLGATAPYACAELVLAEAGERQPRTLANAFMEAVDHKGGQVKVKAATALGDYLARFDAMYGPHEDRRLASMLAQPPAASGEPVSLPDLARWAAGLVHEAG
ncbi:MAG: type I-E CRISPR-associated protein Cas7/Cse4/CasC [Alphaproteobacteria bacterium]|nr:type I-E CRISPR-associated protein Cas7/Cse4/CasC [Alphaproteobacteria bacterium]